MLTDTLQKLDIFYAGALDCAPVDLRSGELKIVPCSDIDIEFAKGYPLAVYGVDTGEGTVLAVQAELATALAGLEFSTLDNPDCDALERILNPHIQGLDWFRGIRLYCDSTTFTSRRIGEVRAVTQDDPTACELHAKWGGEVFGQVVDGGVVSWAAVKPLSDIVWDLRVDTLPEHRGRGYAASVVSAAISHILDSGRITGWGTDRYNTASLKTAQAVGFAHYALDFGCVLPSAFCSLPSVPK